MAGRERVWRGRRECACGARRGAGRLAGNLLAPCPTALCFRPFRGCARCGARKTLAAISRSIRSRIWRMFPIRSRPGGTCFDRRASVVCSSVDEAARMLSEPTNRQIHRSAGVLARPQPVFLFTGQGAQFPGMGRALYQAEPVYRKQIDECAEILRPAAGSRPARAALPGGSRQRRKCRSFDGNAAGAARTIHHGAGDGQTLDGMGDRAEGHDGTQPGRICRRCLGRW